MANCSMKSCTVTDAFKQKGWIFSSRRTDVSEVVSLIGNPINKSRLKLCKESNGKNQMIPNFFKFFYSN